LKVTSRGPSFNKIFVHAWAFSSQLFQRESALILFFPRFAPCHGSLGAITLRAMNAGA
jgi:hypothetical protein